MFHFPYWLSVSYFKVLSNFVSNERKQFVPKCKMPPAQYKEGSFPFPLLLPPSPDLLF